MIQDSGDRRQFESGAVRDMAGGKGRCDLMPLFDVANVFRFVGEESAYEILYKLSSLLRDDLSQKEKYEYCMMILSDFVDFQRELHETSGSFPNLFLEVAVHYEEGAKKYGEHNWEKGLPLWCYVDSATRHFLKYLDSWDDERHDRAFVWNILGYMYTIRNMPPDPEPVTPAKGQSALK